MTIRKFVPLTLALALLGCGPTVEQQAIGTWDGSLNVPKMSAANTAADSMIQSIAKGAEAMVKPTLELRADKTFTMTLIVSMEGTWETDGHQIILTTNKVAGMAAGSTPPPDPFQSQPTNTEGKSTDQPQAPQTIRLELSTDGKSLVPATGQPGFEFIKEQTTSSSGS